MKTNTRLTILRAATLVAAAGGLCATAQAGGLGSDPLESFDLYGVLRDFQSSHPDFGLDSSDAPGHYAGNVQFFADGDFKPVYLGSGAEVSDQWEDKNGKPIAPHLFNFSGYNAWPEGTGVYMTGFIQMGQGAMIDSWNSADGTYLATQNDGAIVGTQATSGSMIDMNHDSTIQGSVLVGPSGDPANVIDTSGSASVAGSTGTLMNAPDPLEVRVPDFGASIGDVEILATTKTLKQSIHVNKFFLGDLSKLIIEGDVEIVCDDRMTIGQGAEIIIAPNSSLRVYTLSDVKAVSQSAMVNVNTMDPSKVTFYHLSGLDFGVSQFTQVYATIYAPGAQVIIQQNADVYGRVLAERLDIDQSGGLHIDENLVIPTDACSEKIGDVPGSFSAAHAGAVTSDRTFRQWFRTLPNVNASQLEAITLKNDGSGVYEYETSDFTIADNDLLGNEGGAHNRHFTMEFGAIAQYDMCKDQFFEYEGDGDAWLLINDRLVIDLHGLGKGKIQFADLDRMGMYDGELYVLRFFYAQRTDDASPFKIRTNANLLYSRGVIPESSGLHD